MVGGGGALARVRGGLAEGSWDWAGKEVEHQWASQVLLGAACPGGQKAGTGGGSGGRGRDAELSVSRLLWACFVLFC